MALQYCIVQPPRRPQLSIFISIDKVKTVLRTPILYGLFIITDDLGQRLLFIPKFSVSHVIKEQHLHYYILLFQRALNETRIWARGTDLTSLDNSIVSELLCDGKAWHETAAAYFMHGDLDDHTEENGPLIGTTLYRKAQLESPRNQQLPVKRRLYWGWPRAE